MKSGEKLASKYKDQTGRMTRTPKPFMAQGTKPGRDNAREARRVKTFASPGVKRRVGRNPTPGKPRKVGAVGGAPLPAALTMSRRQQKFSDKAEKLSERYSKALSKGKTGRAAKFARKASKATAKAGQY